MLTIKSSGQNGRPSPIGAKPLQRLKPRAHGRERIMTSMALTSTDFFLEHPNRSMANEIIFSNTAITVDNAAKTMNI